MCLDCDPQNFILEKKNHPIQKTDPAIYRLKLGNRKHCKWRLYSDKFNIKEMQRTSVLFASKWISGSLVNVLIFKKAFDVVVCLALSAELYSFALIRQGFCGFNLSNKSLLVNWIAWNYCK